MTAEIQPEVGFVENSEPKRPTVLSALRWTVAGALLGMIVAGATGVSLAMFTSVSNEVIIALVGSLGTVVTALIAFGGAIVAAVTAQPDAPPGEPMEVTIERIRAEERAALVKAARG